MDDVICSHLLLSCDYDTFMNLSKVNKKFDKVSEIVWEQWVKKNLKTYSYGRLSYTYCNGKNGKRIYHGTYNVEAFDRTKHRKDYSHRFIPMWSYPEYTLTFKHGKLDGKACFYNNGISFITANYKNGCLH